MRRILAFTGYARSGKDTAAAVLVEQDWTRVAFADPLRAIALVINPWIKSTASEYKFIRLRDIVNGIGWDEAKVNPEVRTLLIDLGTPGVRAHVCDDAWILAAEKTIAGIPGDVVLTDCRFCNEAKWVRSQGGVVVRIVREGAQPLGVADAAVDMFEPDLVIQNNGTIEQLREKVFWLVIHFWK